MGGGPPPTIKIRRICANFHKIRKFSQIFKGVDKREPWLGYNAKIVNSKISGLLGSFRSKIVIRAIEGTPRPESTQIPTLPLGFIGGNGQNRHFSVWGPSHLISVAMKSYHFPSPGAQESNLRAPTGQIPPVLGKRLPNRLNGAHPIIG